MIMGSGFSFFLAAPSPAPEPGLGDLPESVVGSILVYLNPQEICRAAALNRAFRGASSADFVWESKLPENYDSLISRVFDEFPKGLCKRDIYARLSRPNSFDGGSKKVWLDKGTGRACLSISSNGLAITGIDDRRYWSRIPTEESRCFTSCTCCDTDSCRNGGQADLPFYQSLIFGTVSYLQQIWWFEVDGEIDFPFPPGKYSLYFRLQLGRSVKRFGRRVCNSEHVHGWDKKPVKFQLSTSDGQKAISQCYLTDQGKWNLYPAGDFVVEDSSVPTKIKFSMTQIDCTHTKGGLCVDSVLICPK